MLSHVIGALYRVPIQAGYYFDDAGEVFIVFHDPYWIADWEHAPLASFRLALRMGIEGNRALLRALTPDDLLRRAGTAFGDNTLGEFLVIAYEHVHDMHVPQLQAFVD